MGGAAAVHTGMGPGGPTVAGASTAAGDAACTALGSWQQPSRVLEANGVQHQSRKHDMHSGIAKLKMWLRGVQCTQLLLSCLQAPKKVMTSWAAKSACERGCQQSTGYGLGSVQHW